MTIYYPITKEELSEYAKLKAESISADMASMKSVEEKAKKIEEGIKRRACGPDKSLLFRSVIEESCGYRDQSNVCTCEEMLCYLTSCLYKDVNECPVHNEGIKIPKYEVPDYTVCFEELKRKLPWGTLKKEDDVK